jgi:VWFA-related protein
MPVSAAASFGARGRRLFGAVPVLILAGVGAASLAAQQPSFRAAVDLIAVDVQVVDPDGNPIDALEPNAFQVSIKGHKRQVVSAEFIRYAWVDPPKVSAGASVPAGVTTPLATPTSRGGRRMVLAVDIGSFDVGAERAPMEAARQFVDRLEPSDQLGLYVYPNGAWIAPTTDRAILRATLDRLVGQREPLRSHYNLKPWEIVEISTQWTNPNSFLTMSGRQDLATDPATRAMLDPVLRIQARECPNDPDCPNSIYAEGLGLATQLERQAQLSLGGLETLLNGLAQIQGRKSVVLVSAGVLVSDRPEGRPDVGDLARILGQEAARANTVVYTIHVDTNALTPVSASRRASVSSDLGRDRAIHGAWLDQFSGAAGGSRLYVPTGGGGFAFDRVLRESSGYYLLAVEPADEDRDGRPRELKVKVAGKGVTVRSRQWVVIPPIKPGTTAAAPGAAALRR